MGNRTLTEKKIYPILAAVAFFFILMLASTASAQPHTMDVLDVGASYPYQSIQSAIDAASNGDLIIVHSDYDPTQDANGISIDKAVTIQGETPDVVVYPNSPINTITVNGDTVYWQIEVLDSATIKDLTILFADNPGNPSVSMVIDASDVILDNVHFIASPDLSSEPPLALILYMGSGLTASDVTLETEYGPLAASSSGPSPLSPAPPGTTALWVTTSYTTISGFTITGTWDIGIYLDTGATNNLVVSNTIQLSDSVTLASATAIWDASGGPNTIGASGQPNSILLDTSSVTFATYMYGIYAEFGVGITVQYNTIEIRSDSIPASGIYLYNTCGSTISTNTIFSSTANQGVGVEIMDCACTSTSVNTVTDNTIYGLINGITLYATSPGSTAYQTVSNNILHDNDIAIGTYGTDHVNIVGNNLASNDEGIVLDDGTTNTIITDNTFTDDYLGIEMRDGTSDNTVGTGNTFSYASIVAGSIAIDDAGSDNVIAGTSLNVITITNYDSGIYLEGTSSGLQVSWVSISNSYTGIMIDGGSHATISNVIIDTFTTAGIQLDNSAVGNTITDTEIRNGASGSVGILLSSASSTYVGTPGHGNTIHDVDTGIVIASSSAGSYVDGNEIYNVNVGIDITGNLNSIGVNEANTIHDVTSNGIRVGGSGNSVMNNVIYNAATGIRVAGTTNTISNNDVGYSLGGVTNGILVAGGDDFSPNSIADNNIAATGIGIWITATAANNILNNQISCTIGVELDGAVNQLVDSNTITGMSDTGILITNGANSNQVTNNQITGTGSEKGIVIDHSYNNVVNGNYLTNLDIGIYLIDTVSGAPDTTGNQILNNQIIDADPGIEVSGDEVSSNTIQGNSISLSSLSSALLGIYLTGANTGNSVTGNTISGAFSTGIEVESNSFSITNNNIDLTATSLGIGIAVFYSQTGTIGSNTILAAHGIQITDAGGTTAMTVSNNNIGSSSNPINHDGIDIYGSTNIQVTGNTIFADETGIMVTYYLTPASPSTQIVVDNNNIGCTVGVEVSGSEADVTGNTITADDIGIYYHDITISTVHFISGNVISGMSAGSPNKVGIYIKSVTGSAGNELRLVSNTISLASLITGSTGIKIEDSSYVQTLTTQNQISNLDVGVLVTGTCSNVLLGQLLIHDGNTGIRIESGGVTVTDGVELHGLSTGIEVEASNVQVTATTLATTGIYIHDVTTGIHVGNPLGTAYQSILIEKVYFDGTMTEGVLVDNNDAGAISTAVVISECGFYSSGISTGIKISHSVYVEVSDSTPFVGTIGTSGSPLPTGIYVEESYHVEISTVQIYANTGVEVTYASTPPSNAYISVSSSYIDTSIGIHLTNVNGVVATGNYITGLDDGMLIDGASTLVDITGNTICCNDYGIYVTGSSNNIVINAGNAFRDNIVAGIFLDEDVSDVSIDGNTFTVAAHTSGMKAIYVHGAGPDVSIGSSSANSIVDYDYGVYIDDGATGVIVASNSFSQTIASWDLVGVYVTGNSEASIYGNSFAGNQYKFGVQVDSNVLSSYALTIGDMTNPNSFDDIGTSAIYILGSQYVLVEGNDFGSTTDVNMGIEIENSEYVQIDEDYIHGAANVGIYIHGDSDNIEITHVYIENCDVGIQISDWGTIQPTNIYIHDMRNSIGFGITSSNKGIYIDSVVADSSYGIKIENVDIWDINNYGVHVVSSQYILMDGLHMWKTSTSMVHGVYVDSSSNVDLENSQFTEDTATAETVYYDNSLDSLIEGNSFTGSSSTGDIAVNGGEGIWIHANYFQGTTGRQPPYGISIVGSKAFNIYGNAFQASPGYSTYGIYVQNVVDTIVSEVHDNTFQSGCNVPYAIFVSTSNGPLSVYNNHIYGSSGYGVYISSSSNVEVRTNDFHNLDYDVYVVGSNSISILGNTHMSSSSTATVGIYITGGSSAITVSDWTGTLEYFYGTYYNAIKVENSNNVVLSNTMFSANTVPAGYAVILVTDSNNINIENNIFSDQPTTGGTYDILLNTLFGNTYTVLIFDNEFHGGQYGIYGTGNLYDIKVYDNEFYTNGMSAGIVFNGLTYGPTTSGVEIHDNYFNAGSVNYAAIEISSVSVDIPISVYANTIEIDASSRHGIDIIDAGTADYPIAIYSNSLTSTSLTNTIAVYVSGSSAMSYVHAYQNTQIQGFTFAFYATGKVSGTIENHASGAITGNSFGFKAYYVTDGEIDFQNNYVTGYGTGSTGAEVEGSGSPALIQFIGNNIGNVYTGISIVSNTNNVNIQGNTIEATQYDVYITTASNNILVQSNTLDATYGIYLNGVSYIIITDNEIYDNTYGVWVEDSSYISIDNSVDANLVHDNTAGILLTGTDSSILITGNEIYDNVYGVKLESVTISSSSITGNSFYFTATPTADSYFIYMDSTATSTDTLDIDSNTMTDLSAPATPAHSYGVYVDSTNVIFTLGSTFGNDISYLEYGVYITGPVPSGSMVYYNDVHNNYYGIYLDGSSLPIYHNTIMYNQYGGYVTENGVANSFGDDTWPNWFQYNQYGLYILEDGALLNKVNQFANNYYGIYLDGANGAGIYKQQFTGSYLYSIYVDNSDGVTIGASGMANTFTGLAQDGIFATGSDNILVQYNTFNDVPVGTAINITASSAPTVVYNTGTGLNVGIHVWGGVDYADIEHNTLAGASTYGILVDGVSTPRTTVAYNDISGFDHGICVVNSQHVDISNNNVHGNDCGICIADSSDVVVEWNTLSGNTNSLCLSGTLSGVIIRYNDISGGSCGIHVYNVHGGLIIAKNKIHDNTVGICIESSSDVQVIQHKPDYSGDWGIYDNGIGIRIYSNSDSIFVNDNNIYMTAGYLDQKGVVIEESTNNNVSENQIYNLFVGVDVLSGSGNAIWNNEIYDVTTGVGVNGPSTVVKDNYIHDADLEGVGLGAGADGSSILRNTIENSGWGIYGEGSDTDPIEGLLVQDNEISGIDITGIFLDYTTGAQISDNEVTGLGSSSLEGVFIGDSSGFTMSNNRISSFEYGVWITASSNFAVDGNDVGDISTWGIYVENSDLGDSPGASISGNAVHDVGATGSGVGIYFNSILGGVISIDSNSITTVGWYGIQVYSSTATLIVQGNSISGAGYAGINIWNLDGSATVSSNQLSATGTGIDALQDSGPTGTIVVSGNTVQNEDLYGIDIEGFADVTVSDNSVTDVGMAAIYVYQANSASINGNTATNAQIGIVANHVGSADIGANSIQDVAGQGIYVTSSTTATVYDNTVQDSLTGIMVDSYSMAYIYSNYIEDSSNLGIYVGFSYVEIHDNSIINTMGTSGASVYLYGADGSLVYGNTITYSSNNGIVADTSNDVAVYGNSITDVYNYAIYFTGSDGGYVHDNTIAAGSYYSPSVGIMFELSDYAEIENNIVNSAYSGIELDSSSYAYVLHNTISDPVNYGMYLLDSDSVDVENNTISLSVYASVGIYSYGSAPLYIMTNEITGPLDLYSRAMMIMETDDDVKIAYNTISANRGILTYDLFWDSYIYENEMNVGAVGIDVMTSWWAEIHNNTITSSEGLVGIRTVGFDSYNDVFDALIYGNYISGFNYGMKIENYTDYPEIYDNVIEDTGYGIAVFASYDYQYLEAHDNTISSSIAGIYIKSEGNRIYDALSSNHIVASTGIQVEGARYVNASYNEISASEGIVVESWTDGSTWYYANDAFLWYNNITASDTGIFFFDSWFDDVYYNNVTAANYGIEMQAAGHTDVYYNNVTADFGIVSVGGLYLDIVENTVTASGSNAGILSSNDFNVDVVSNAVSGFDYGIYVMNGEDVDILSNSVTGSTYGIYDTGAVHENNIDGNYVSSSYYGIYVTSPTDYANVTDNTVTGAYLGIYMYDAVSNLINGNTVIDSQFGIEVEQNDGTTVSHNTVDVSDTGIAILSSNAIDAAHNEVTSSMDGIVAVSSTYNYIEYNLVTAGNYGIAAYNDEGSWIQHNTVTEAAVGIFIGSSTSTEVYSNDVTAATGIGILDSSYVHVRYNDVTADYMGIYVHGASSFQIIEYNDVNSSAYGIVLDAAISTTVFNNDVSAVLAGIYLNGDLNSEVTFNDVSNAQYGVLVDDGAFQFIDNNTITSPYIGIEVSSGDGVTVSANDVTAAYVGIHLADDTASSEVKHNDVTSMYMGILVEDSTDDLVEGNSVNAMIGIKLDGTMNMVVTENAIAGGFVYRGIEVRDTTYAYITWNTVTQPVFGIAIFGEREARLSYIAVNNNTVTYASLYGIYVKYADYVYVNDNTVQESMYGIVLKRSTHVIAMGDSTYMDRIGYYVLFSSEVRVTGVFTQNDDNGFFIERSAYVAVDNSTFYRDVFAGVVSDSQNFVIENNTVTECVYGFVVRGSSDALIQNNAIEMTVYIGVWIDMSSDVQFVGNFVHDSYVANLKAEDSTGLVIEHNTFLNSTNGIVFSNVAASTFAYNEVSGAYEYGIMLTGSSGNSIYLNNFIDNNRGGMHSSQAFDDGSNTYYTMLLVGGSYVYYGNYWSDHTSPDDNGDGIVDTPYAIDGGSNQDPYPLVAPVTL